MQINPEANARQIAESWVNGNISRVIDQLKNDHPGLTAMVIVQGTYDGLLTVADCNTICDLLIDDRYKRLQGETTCNK